MERSLCRDRHVAASTWPIARTTWTWIRPTPTSSAIRCCASRSIGPITSIKQREFAAQIQAKIAREMGAKFDEGPTGRAPVTT